MTPGTDGMTDAATANGNDRDPEIELFVKVGRCLGSRRTCLSSSKAPGGAGSRAWARAALGRWTIPREGSPVLVVPWVAFCKAEPGFRALGRNGVRCNLASGCLLRELAGGLSKPPQDRQSPLQFQSPAPRDVGFS